MNARRLLPLVLAVLLLCACGKSKNVVLLLPDPDGHVGVVDVTNAQGAQTLTQAGTATRIAPKAAPGAPEVLTAQEQEQLFGPALRALPSRPVRFVLYFETDGTRLTPESQALLPKVLATATERVSRDIAVVGHASKLGDENFNIELSRKRAEFVSRMLVKAGIPQESLEITSHGSANPLVITKRQNEPQNRRVEITVR